MNDINIVTEMGQIIKVQRPVSSDSISACIIGLYSRPVSNIRGRIYNSLQGVLLFYKFK